VLCKNIDVHKLAPRKSQYLITTEDRGQSVMLKCALNVRDLALAIALLSNQFSLIFSFICRISSLSST
ncbi:hypothetical protein, partial [Shewanella xiamenensis]|uniref:hypothetical protein n=1 Tax=Shewanella xiamenensis TaxID=332186 RepID=UPI001C4E101B